MAAKTRPGSGNPAKRAEQQARDAKQRQLGKPAPAGSDTANSRFSRVIGTIRDAGWRPKWAIAVALLLVLCLFLPITEGVAIIGSANSRPSDAYTRTWLMIGNLTMISASVPLVNLVAFLWRGGKVLFWAGAIGALGIMAWALESGMIPF